MTHDLVHETTESADGTTIGFYRRGSGPALVITHGSISTGEQWLPATEHLAEHFTCLVPDRRGRGRSGELAADTRPYDLAAEVADIAAVVAVAGPGTHLLGHSYGALCTLAYAQAHGVEGTLVVYEPPLAVDGPVAGEHLARYRYLVDSGDLGAALEHALAHFVRLPVEAIPVVRATPLWGASVPLTPTWVRELEQIDALGADLGHYGSITGPVRVLAGTATSPFLHRSALELAEVLPDATVTELPGMDHFAHLADPAGFASTVRSLLT